MAAYIPPSVFDNNTRRTSTETTSTNFFRPIFGSNGLKDEGKMSEEQPKRTLSSLKKNVLRPKMFDKWKRQPILTVEPDGDDVGRSCDGRHEVEETCEQVEQVEQVDREEANEGEAPDRRHSMFLTWLRGNEEESVPICEKEVENKAEDGLDCEPERKPEHEPGRESALVKHEQPAYFRCDIFATSGSDYIDAERECKQLITEAGGTILDDFEYLGGFLYSLPPNKVSPRPLESSDETLLGGYIRITSFERFQPPHPNPLRMNLPSESLIHMSTNLPPSRAVPGSPDKPSSGAPLVSISTAPSSITDSPATPRKPHPNTTPVFPPSASASDTSKEWPRPRDLAVTKRAGDWIKYQAAQRRQKLDEEAREGYGMEVLDDGEIKRYEGGVETGGLYLDGFSDLAVWLSREQREAVRATLELL